MILDYTENSVVHFPREEEEFCLSAISSPYSATDITILRTYSHSKF